MSDTKALSPKEVFSNLELSKLELDSLTAKINYELLSNGRAGVLETWISKKNHLKLWCSALSREAVPINLKPLWERFRQAGWLVEPSEEGCRISGRYTE